MIDPIIGCPHEEGTDYTEGKTCHPAMGCKLFTMDQVGKDEYGKSFRTLRVVG